MALNRNEETRIMREREIEEYNARDKAGVICGDISRHWLRTSIRTRKLRNVYCNAAHSTFDSGKFWNFFNDLSDEPYRQDNIIIWTAKGNDDLCKDICEGIINTADFRRPDHRRAVLLLLENNKSLRERLYQEWLTQSTVIGGDNKNRLKELFNFSNEDDHSIVDYHVVAEADNYPETFKRFAFLIFGAKPLFPDSLNSRRRTNFEERTKLIMGNKAKRLMESGLLGAAAFAQTEVVKTIEKLKQQGKSANDACELAAKIVDKSSNNRETAITNIRKAFFRNTLKNDKFLAEQLEKHPQVCAELHTARVYQKANRVTKGPREFASHFTSLMFLDTDHKRFTEKHGKFASDIGITSAVRTICKANIKDTNGEPTYMGILKISLGFFRTVESVIKNAASMMLVDILEFKDNAIREFTGIIQELRTSRAQSNQLQREIAALKQQIAEMRAAPSKAPVAQQGEQAPAPQAPAITTTQLSGARQQEAAAAPSEQPTVTAPTTPVSQMGMFAAKPTTAAEGDAANKHVSEPESPSIVK